MREIRPNRELRRQRQLRGWSLDDVADGLNRLASDDDDNQAGPDRSTVSRWERGLRRPHPRNVRLLCLLFELPAEVLGLVEEDETAATEQDEQPALTLAVATSIHPIDPPPRIYVASAQPPVTEPGPGWTTWFSLKLAQLIALIDQWQLQADSAAILQILLHQEITMFEAVRPIDHEEPYALSRRQVLVTLVALPVALCPSLQPGSMSSILMSRFLRYCAASITASWHLLKLSDLAIVEQTVSAYLLALAAAARQPSQHQAEAARLVSQAYRLLGIVALHHKHFRARQHYFEQAVLYADIAGDPSMQASALVSLGSTPLLYTNDPVRAAESYQRALLHQSEIPRLQRSRIFAELAVALAMQRQEQEALRYIRLAEEEYPEHPEHDPSFLYAEFTPASFTLDRGLAYLALARHLPNRDYQQRAWTTFEEIEQLTRRGPVPQRIQVEVQNQQAATAIELRDLDMVSSYLRLGVGGADALQSDQRRHEALVVWRNALTVWPGERRVQALGELFAGRLSADAEVDND